MQTHLCAFLPIQGRMRQSASACTNPAGGLLWLPCDDIAHALQIILLNGMSIYIRMKLCLRHDATHRATMPLAGAGTTGAGLAAGCPTMTVPFFGDQAFWGEMCRRAGVGPAPVAIEHLTPQRLLDGLTMLTQPEASALL